MYWWINRATLMQVVYWFFGLMKLGSVIKYVPYQITTGFTSGIAVVSLVHTGSNDFFGLSDTRWSLSEFFENGEYI